MPLDRALYLNPFLLGRDIGALLHVLGNHRRGVLHDQRYREEASYYALVIEHYNEVVCAFLSYTDETASEVQSAQYVIDAKIPNTSA
jgi:hypothetical protein